MYGLTRRGKGPARVLTVQTAEDGKPSWENLLYLRKWRFHYPVETYIICHALSTTTYGLEIITNELKHLDSYPSPIPNFPFRDGEGNTI